jgi:hypothetical protein
MLIENNVMPSAAKHLARIVEPQVSGANGGVTPAREMLRCARHDGFLADHFVSGSFFLPPSVIRPLNKI